MDPVHGLVDLGRRLSMVGHGQCLGGGSLEDGQNGASVRETSLWLRKKGEGTAVILTGCRRWWRRGGSDRATVGKKQWRKHSVRAMLGLRKKRKRAGGGAVKDDGALPFYNVRGGGGSSGREWRPVVVNGHLHGCRYRE
jgi:hypothetical protein